MCRVVNTGTPVVGIAMGSDSDWPAMQAAAEVLQRFGVPYEALPDAEELIGRRRIFVRHQEGQNTPPPDIVIKHRHRNVQRSYRIDDEHRGGKSDSAQAKKQRR